MNLLDRINLLLNEYWVSSVETHWTPPSGLFTQSADKIAEVLAKESNSLKQASSRLSFYINRAGKNLSGKRKSNLKKVYGLLRQKFSGEKQE